MAALPARIRQGLKDAKKWFFDRFNLLADRICFPIWLLLRCLRHRKRAVILHRINALGDVICTLPMCPEIRSRYPGRFFVFVTVVNYKTIVMLSSMADDVFGSRSWNFFPGTIFGLVEKVYSPQTTDERDSRTGAQCHLVDDLAASCGITVPARQPKLFPSPELIAQTLATYGLNCLAAAPRQMIGISCGRTWPVRMWDAAKWQQLVDRIHAEYDVTILQFGFTNGPDEADEFDQIQGVVSVTNRLKSEELVALVSSCRLLVSIDSGPVHIAGAVGVPVVGLFGAVNPKFRLPTASPAASVCSNVPCLFCHNSTPIGHWKNGCPYQIRCMKELDVGPVFAAVKTMLAKHGRTPQ